jgi:UDP-N-acetylmuramoylalanine--D-glutamate ligase
VVWIAGGLSKGVDYDELVSTHAGRLKAVVLIGADSTALRGSLARHAPDVPVIETAGGQTGRVMAAAVAAAAAVATPGDTVLMAPASASMDQFTSYAHRGKAFIDAVRELVQAQARTGTESTSKES